MKKINNTCFSIHGTQNDELRTFISGKVVFTNYGNQQTRPYTISGLNNESAVTQTFQTEDGKQTTVNNYYRQRYQINLQYPEWPLAEVKSKGKLLYFPLETLNIADYQKVKPCDITSEDTAAMVKACAVPPSEKQRQINIAHASFGINDDPFCKKLGLETVDEPMILKARTLGAPKIQYSGGSSTPGADGKWILPRGQFTYLKTCSIKKWAYVVIESGRIVFDHNGFIRAFMNEAKNRGITVDPPDYVFTFESQHFYQQDFEKIFYESRSYNYEFLLFLHEKHVDSIKAFERSSSIITQCVNIPTAFKILNQNSRLTLENIVAKTNA
uniref:PAZ domain-containing protein n=1 Tax=Panagrolaimus superbus TaxID=310955 RepID=A0A914YIV8_9BILA